MLEMIQRLTVEVAELRLKYSEADEMKRQEIDRLKAQLQLQHNNTLAEGSSLLLQYHVSEVYWT